ncbi:MAG: aminoacyl-tRNA hydrolase [Candidatus Krumholzibacteria bacterium]|nr:aminoacyl-tRNA hydrolase [Candidatus Krumholzibacteria bacterium]MDH4337277.1 aminoacyl-tRNA hydrolase [Candidatus Krumholzibacteria bacterium]MDH5270010.1 aminoacyl-tRNA hydrolase [Candidatus Krumholzibacteria bacterium]
MAVEYLVAGLGNPGDRYRNTRHNLGFHVVEALGRARGARWREQGGNRRVARMALAGRDLLLVEPLTFMNLSGNALRPIVDAESLPPARVLVVCDDIALPLGQLRLRPGGSDGGHNGLVSVIERLETTGFPRLRMGVGPVPPRVDAAEFVLAEFLPEEQEAVAEMIGTAAECVAAWVTTGIDRAMGRYNARKEPPPEE